MLDSLFNHVVHCSVLGATAIVAVMLIRWLGGRRLAPAMRCVLWAVAGVLLVAPQLPDLGLGLRPPAKPVMIKRITARATVSGGTPVIQQTVVPMGKAETAAMNLNHGPAAQRRAVSLALLWSGGVVLVLGGWLLSYGMLRRRVRRMEEAVPAGLQATLTACAQTMGLTRTPRLRATRAVRAPAVMGLFRPEILVPPSLNQTLEPQELRMVLMHECAHLRRHDLSGHWTAMLLVSLHWFNPFCWLALRMLHADREAACDAAVLAACDSDQRSSYGHTLLKLGAAVAPCVRFQSLVGVLGSVDRLRTRIVEIARFGSSSRSAGRLTLASVVLGAAALAVAAAEPPKPKTTVTRLDSPAPAAPPAIRPPAEPAPLPTTSPAVPETEAPSPPAELLQRTFRVPPDFLSNITPQELKVPTANGLQPLKLTAKELLSRMQVTFPEGASVFYNAAASQLVVRNTVENLERIRRLAEKALEPPLLIHVNSTLAAFDPLLRGRSKELAQLMTTISNSSLVQWTSFEQREQETKTKGDEGIPAFAVRLTKSQREQMLRLLQKTASAEDKSLAQSVRDTAAQASHLINLPSVTLKSGSPATVEAVREFFHPTQYGVGPDNLKVATPTAFEMQPLGAIITLTPALRDDRSTMDIPYQVQLAAVLEMRDFKSEAGDKLQLPLFQINRRSGSVDLKDGETLAILMNEAPITPFLTNSAAKGAETTKGELRPVIVLLTASLIDPTGQKIKKDG